MHIYIYICTCIPIDIHIYIHIYMFNLPILPLKATCLLELDGRFVSRQSRDPRLYGHIQEAWMCVIYKYINIYIYIHIHIHIYT